MKRNSIVTALLIIIAVFNGCSARKSDYSSATSTVQNSAGAAYDTAAEVYDMEESEMGSDGNQVQIRSEKIIKTGSIDMETNRFDFVIDTIKATVTDNGGYIENGNLQVVEVNKETQRRYFAVLRVPTETFDMIKTSIEGIGKVLSSSENAENVTAAYYDIESRLRTRQTEEQRVLDMIDEARKIEDLINLEQRLGEIRTDIELYQNQIAGINSKTRYSTIHVNVSEVATDEMLRMSDNLGQRIEKSFIKSTNNTISFLQDVIVFLAGAVIPLLIIAFLAAVGLTIAKMYKKKYDRH